MHKRSYTVRALGAADCHNWIVRRVPPLRFPFGMKERA